MTEPIKCLSLWEPWASLVRLGEKGWETRSWSTSYRGPLLIHAALRWSRDQEVCLRMPLFQRALANLNPGGPIRREHLHCGRAVALVTLWDCRPVELMKPEDLSREGAFGDYSAGRWAWGLANRQMIAKPYPLLGRQGLFDVPYPEVEMLC